jgi:hypothetical protein
MWEQVDVGIANGGASSTTTTSTSTEPCSPGVDGGSSVWSSQYGSFAAHPFPAGSLGGIAVDSEGNVVVAGAFTGSIDLGCGALMGTDLVWNGYTGYSGFVAKLDPSGACLWSQSFGASQDYDGGIPPGYGYAPGGWVGGVAVDASNNVILLGEFGGSFVVGNDQLTGDGLFAAKLDPAGAPLWSATFGDSVFRGSYLSVAVDAQSNVFLTGELSGSADIAGHVLTSPSTGTNLVIKLDPGGGPMWGKTFDAWNTLDGQTFVSGANIAVDASGNVFLTGEASDSADFGCGAPLSLGENSAFLAKLDPDGGACVWADGLSSTAPGNSLGTGSIGAGVAVTPGGQIAVTGMFIGPGSLEFGAGAVTGTADQNLFVVTLDAGGGLVWAKAFGASGEIYGEAIAVDATGNIFVTGTVLGSVDFGSGTLTSTGANGDLFVASFDGGGTLRWAKLFNASTAALSYLAIAASPTCRVVVAGDFEGSLDFGGVPLTSATAEAVFVAALTQ